FFNLLDQRQFKSQRVIALRPFHTLSHRALHLLGGKVYTIFRMGQRHKKERICALFYPAIRQRD
ncbi:hypothetical protein NG896_13035, partial [Aeromonas veronii]|uniref:hypothetical protein n=1 Tax=Aeromonas veronii TaxID=654 RepID=UPI0020914D4F